jgi:hypothetical protein
LGSERKQSSFALNSQISCIGRNRDFVDGLANQAIRGTKNLDGANEIKLLHRGHYQNDDSPPLEARASVLARG